MSYLTSIARLSSADNLGGVLTIEVARAADIETIPDPVDDQIFGDVTFLPGRGFHSWQVSLESASADVRSRPSIHGTSEDTTVPFIIPKNKPDILTMLRRAVDDTFIIIITDANGSRKMFGQKHAPVKLRFDSTSGKSQADLNHYRCEFYCSAPENLFHYNGNIAAAPPGAAPVILRVNGVVMAVAYAGQIIDVDTDFEFDFNIIGT